MHPEILPRYFLLRSYPKMHGYSFEWLPNGDLCGARGEFVWIRGCVDTGPISTERDIIVNF